MPLRLDPASIMAPGGVASGLDNLGAAVMNAMNRRAERKYALEAAAKAEKARLEAEQRQRGYADSDYARNLADKRADDKAKRDYEAGEKEKERASREKIARDKTRAGLIGKVMSGYARQAASAAGVSPNDMREIYINAGLQPDGVNLSEQTETDVLGQTKTAWKRAPWTPEQRAAVLDALNRKRSSLGLGAANQSVVGGIENSYAGLEEELKSYDIDLGELRSGGGVAAAAVAKAPSGSPLDAAKEQLRAQITEARTAPRKDGRPLDPATVAKRNRVAEQMLKDLDGIKDDAGLPAFGTQYKIGGAAPVPAAAAPGGIPVPGEPEGEQFPIPYADATAAATAGHAAVADRQKMEADVRAQAAALAGDFQKEVAGMPQLPPNRSPPLQQGADPNVQFFNQAVAAAANPAAPYPWAERGETISPFGPQQMPVPRSTPEELNQKALRDWMVAAEPAPVHSQVPFFNQAVAEAERFKPANPPAQVSYDPREMALIEAMRRANGMPVPTF